MAAVKPFICIRPRGEMAARTAALPYDVYNRQEACEAVKGNPYSFLNIDRPETQFPAEVDTYDDRVYEKARELLDSQIKEGIYVTDPDPAYYLYELTMDGRSQTGIVACCAVDDYINGVIKKHENTREDKEHEPHPPCGCHQRPYRPYFSGLPQAGGIKTPGGAGKKGEGSV